MLMQTVEDDSCKTDYDLRASVISGHNSGAFSMDSLNTFILSESCLESSVPCRGLHQATLNYISKKSLKKPHTTNQKQRFEIFGFSFIGAETAQLVECLSEKPGVILTRV